MKIGDIVLIGDENKKRIYWPMGKIISFFPSSDGLIRSVKLKTSKGELDRPVQRLYPMEASEDEVPKLRNGINIDQGKPTSKKKRKLVIEARPEATVVQQQSTRSGRKIKAPDRLNYRY